LHLLKLLSDLNYKQQSALQTSFITAELMGEPTVLSVANDTSGSLQLHTTLLPPFRITAKLYENLE